MGYLVPPTIAVEEGYRLALRRVFGSPAYKLDRDRTVLGWDASGLALHVLWRPPPSRLERWDALTGACTRSAPIAARRAESMGLVGASEAVLSLHDAAVRSPSNYQRWDLDAGAPSRRPLPSQWQNASLLTSADHSTLVASRDGATTVWALPGGARVRELRGHAIDLSADGARVLTSHAHGWLAVWRRDGTLVRSEIRVDPQTRVRLSHDGTALVMGRRDGALACVDVATGEARWETVLSDRAVVHVARSRDGASYYALSEGERLSVVAADGRLRWRTVLRRPRSSVLERGQGTKLAVSPDGAWLAVVGAGPALRIVDATSGVERSAIEGHRGAVTCLAVSRDGRLVASGGDDGDLRVCDAATGETVWVLEVDADAVAAVDFAPDGSALHTCGGDGVVRRWSLARGAEEGSLVVAEMPALGVKSAPDGSHVALFSATTVEVWSDLAPSPARWSIEDELGWEWSSYDDRGDHLRAAAFFPDASRVVVARWDSTGVRLTTLDVATAARFGPPAVLTGRYLALVETDAGPVAITEDDGVLALTEAWAPYREQRLPTGPVWDAQLSADRCWLVTAEDRRFELWDLRSLAPRVVGRVDFDPAGDAPEVLAFSPRADALVVGSRRGCVLTFALGAVP